MTSLKESPSRCWTAPLHCPRNLQLLTELRSRYPRTSSSAVGASPTGQIPLGSSPRVTPGNPRSAATRARSESCPDALPSSQPGADRSIAVRASPTGQPPLGSSPAVSSGKPRSAATRPRSGSCPDALPSSQTYRQQIGRGAGKAHRSDPARVFTRSHSQQAAISRDAAAQRELSRRTTFLPAYRQQVDRGTGVSHRSAPAPESLPASRDQPQRGQLPRAPIRHEGDPRDSTAVASEVVVRRMRTQLASAGAARRSVANAGRSRSSPTPG